MTSKPFKPKSHICVRLLYSKIILLVLLQFCFLNNSLLAQTEKDSAVSKNLERIVDSLKINSIPKLIKYKKYRELEKLHDDKIKTKGLQDPVALEIERDSLYQFHNWHRQIVEYLFELEKNNYEQNGLKQTTMKTITSFKDLRHLNTMMVRVINRFDSNSTAHEQLIRRKLIHAISDQMKLIAENTQAWYNFNTVEKQWIKGIQIESSNDLFAIGGFQKNNDVDYTGSLKVSISTDLFKMHGLIPTQSYQNIIYGGEVFTPFFKDTIIFPSDTSFSLNDRPHANFEYIGYEINAISNNYRWRWTFSPKIGIIGGRFGYNFQYFLHRDISLSPYPNGWDAQIGNDGRLALQGNLKIERLFFNSQANLPNNPFRILVPSGSAELAIGHFMSYGELGFNLSSQNFRNRNQDNILPPGKHYTGYQRLRFAKGYYNFNFSGRHVIHNTMLEGFGVFQDSEKDPDSFADESQHKLGVDEVKDFVFFSNVTLGAQFSKFNVFYKYSIKSPEVNIENAVEIDGVSINDRWHHYATIGLSFIL